MKRSSRSPRAAWLLGLVALLDLARGEELAGEVLHELLALVELLGLVVNRAGLEVQRGCAPRALLEKTRADPRGDPAPG